MSIAWISGHKVEVAKWCYFWIIPSVLVQALLTGSIQEGSKVDGNFPKRKGLPQKELKQPTLIYFYSQSVINLAIPSCWESFWTASFYSSRFTAVLTCDSLIFFGFYSAPPLITLGRSSLVSQTYRHSVLKTLIIPTCKSLSCLTWSCCCQDAENVKMNETWMIQVLSCV